MPSRKRTRQEAIKEDDPPVHVEHTLLDRIRNTSEFAALMQYLFVFGKAMKVPEISIEVRRHLRIPILGNDLRPEQKLIFINVGF
jgi:hypothetical protein